MIITISGKAGSGKSTVAKLLSKRLGLTHYSVGDVMRQMASEKGISILELNRRAEKDPSIDKELDERLIQLGKKEDGFVIDGRLTAIFIPHAKYRIFLDADAKTRARRIFSARRADERNVTFEETLMNVKKREQSEKKRYREYYGVDYAQKKHYTHVIDTAPLDIEGVLKKILSFVKT